MGCFREEEGIASHFQSVLCASNKNLPWGWDSCLLSLVLEVDISLWDACISIQALGEPFYWKHVGKMIVNSQNSSWVFLQYAELTKSSPLPFHLKPQALGSEVRASVQKCSGGRGEGGVEGAGTWTGILITHLPSINKCRLLDCFNRW